MGSLIIRTLLICLFIGTVNALCKLRYEPKYYPNKTLYFEVRKEEIRTHILTPGTYFICNYVFTSCCRSNKLARFNIKFSSSNGNVSLFFVPGSHCYGSSKGYVPDLSLLNVQSYEGTLNSYPPDHNYDYSYCYFFRSENFYESTNLTITRFHVAGELFIDPQAEQKHAIRAPGGVLTSEDGNICFERSIEQLFDHHWRTWKLSVWTPFLWGWDDYKQLLGY